MADPLILPNVVIQPVPVGLFEVPVVKVVDVPASLNVGDRVKPKAEVYRADGVTPIPGCAVDFFVVDSLGAMALGDRVKTDASGVATATEFYYVGVSEAGLSIVFVVVTRRAVI